MSTKTRIEKLEKRLSMKKQSENQAQNLPPNVLVDQYCRKCGSRLLDEYIPDHFNKNTGEQVYRVVSCCINRRPWNFGHEKYARGIWNGRTISVLYVDGDGHWVENS